MGEFRRKSYVKASRDAAAIARATVSFCFSFSIPFNVFSPFFFSLPPSRNSDQPLGHIAGSSLSFPATVRALPFYREKISPLFSLVDSRRNGHDSVGRGLQWEIAPRSSGRFHKRYSAYNHSAAYFLSSVVAFHLPPTKNIDENYENHGKYDGNGTQNTKQNVFF